MICKQKGCKKKVEIRGYCSYHYNIAVRSNEIDKETKCVKPGCDNNHYSKGLCYVHYTRRVRDSDNPCVGYTAEEEATIKDNYNKIPIDELIVMLPGRSEQAIRSKARKLGVFKYAKSTVLAPNFAGKVLRYIPEVLEDVDLDATGYESFEDLLDDEGGQGKIISGDLIAVLFAIVKPVDFNICYKYLHGGETFEQAGQPFDKSAGAAQNIVRRSAIKLKSYAHKILEGLGAEAIEEAKADIMKKDDKGICKMHGCTRNSYSRNLCAFHYCVENNVIVPFSEKDADGAMSLKQMAELIGVTDGKLRSNLGNVTHYRINSKIVFLEKDRESITNQLSG